MQKTPLISVVIAAYNHEKFVRLAVESVLHQTYANVEVIVVDDGSSDRTLAVIRQITDRRIKIIALKENRKFSPRNIGLRHCHGQYVAFQNSDDVWITDKLQKQLNYLEANQKVGVVFTAVKLIDPQGRLLKHSWASNIFALENKNRQAWLRHFLTHGNCFCISSALIRRSVLDRVGGFNESLVQLADFDLWVRVAAVAEIFVLPEQLTLMRIIEGKNFSTPTPLSTNRSAVEYMQVLERFAEEPILSQLRQIIPGKVRSLIPLKVIQQGRLIQKCWEIGSPAHLLFATQLANRLLANTTHRLVLTNFFGTAFIQNYILLKGKVKLTLMENSP